VALITLKVMVQLPLAGMLAPAMVTVLAELVKVPDAPLQVVVGAGEVCTLRLAGMVSVKPDWVKAKPFVLLKVMVSVEAAFALTLVGEKSSVTVGGTGVNVMGVGHAVADVPALVGAIEVAPVELNVTIACSVLLAESVTVRVNIPGVPFQTAVTCAAMEVGGMLTPPDAVHLYEATLSGTLGVTLTSHAATLPLASKTAGLFALNVVGSVTAAIGFCAAFTAFKAFIIPAPHWLPSLGQAHSPLFGSLVGQTGRPGGW
jgi:hypothetical protein